MNDVREKGMFTIALAAIVVLIILLATCACGSKKVVAEYVSVHDTLVVTHSDTVRVDKWFTHYDTLRIETERVVTLVRDTVGRVDTVRIDNSTVHWQHVADKDSESRFVAKVDSILRVLDKQHEKQQTTTKRNGLPWWEWLIIGVSLAFGCIGVLTTRK